MFAHDQSRHSYQPILWIFSALLLLKIPAPAQQFSSNEITVSAGLQTYGVQSFTPIGSTGTCHPIVEHSVFPAPSITYTRNLSPSLAIDGVAQLPASFLGTGSSPAGRQALVLGGVKTGRRGRRWGFYGKMQAGFASYGCENYSSPSSNCTRLTNFALEYGGVTEYQMTSRWALRLDAAHLLMPQFDQIIQRYSDGSALVFLPGSTMQHLDARLGITRSFGALREQRAEPVPNVSAWDVGLLFALQPRTQPEWMMINAYPTLGAWASWNLSRHVSWDTALMHSGRNAGQAFVDYQTGGRAFEALTGLKMGIRRDHMGYFGKIRGGTITFGETFRQIGGNPNGTITNVDLGMFTNPVLDVGGVLEVYPSPHSILRVDAGSATIFYQPKDVIYFGRTIAIPEQTQTTTMMSFGGGFRF